MREFQQEGVHARANCWCVSDQTSIVAEIEPAGQWHLKVVVQGKVVYAMDGLSEPRLNPNQST